MTTKKTQIVDVLSIKNGGFYNYLLLGVGTYGHMHLCKKNHKNQVHQKKLLFLATTKTKTRLVCFWRNGMTLKHDILHKGTYELFPKHDTAEILILFS